MRVLMCRTHVELLAGRVPLVTYIHTHTDHPSLTPQSELHLRPAFDGGMQCVWGSRQVGDIQICYSKPLCLVTF